MLFMHNTVPGNLCADFGDASRFDDSIKAGQLRQEQRILRHHVFASRQRIFTLVDAIGDTDRFFGDAQICQRFQRALDIQVGNGKRFHACHAMRDMHHARSFLAAAHQTHTNWFAVRLSFLQMIKQLHGEGSLRWVADNQAMGSRKRNPHGFKPQGGSSASDKFVLMNDSEQLTIDSITWALRHVKCSIVFNCSGIGYISERRA